MVPAFLTGALARYILVGLAAFGAGYGLKAKIASADLAKAEAGFSEYKTGVAEATRKLLEEHEVRVTELRGDLSRIEHEHYAQLEQVKTDNAELRQSVRDGNRRLSIRATCPASPGAGLATPSDSSGLDVAETGRADIHPEAAAALVAIANDADELRARLIALQAWIETHENRTRKADNQER